MANNIKVEVADGAYEGMDSKEQVQSLQDFLLEMQAVANSVDNGTTSTPEDFLQALMTIGVVEIKEIELEDSSFAVVVKKIVN
jgi:hypothetical protein